MLLFASPLLLIAFPIVAAIGLWALLQQRRHTQRVSSTRLWQGLATSGGTQRRRAVDPAWLLLFLAALLACLALAGPRWRTGGGADLNLPRAGVHMALRTLPHSDHVELFLKIANAHDLPANLAVEYDGNAAPADRMASSVEQVVTSQALTGVILHPPPPSFVADGRDHTIRLLAAPRGAHTEAVLASFRFSPPATAPFALLTLSDAQHPMDAALERVFSIQPGARPNDATIRPAVLLVSTPTFDAGQLAPDTLVIALPDVSLPGIERQAQFHPADRPPTAINLPPFVNLTGVRASAMTEATLSPPWRVAATVDGRPWIAIRSLSPAGPALCWLGSIPSTQTNWPRDRSFVLFFSELLHTFLKAAPVPLEWAAHPMRIPQESPVDVVRVWRLDGLCGIGIVLLISTALLIFYRRA